VEYKGLGSCQNSEEISSDDLQYLSGLLETYLFLRGVSIVPPSEADIDIYITVDVFGTVRTRVDWFLTNIEILRAKTVRSWHRASQRKTGDATAIRIGRGRIQ
jgi:hypothetical protein